MPFYKSFIDGNNTTPVTIPADLQCLRLLHHQLGYIPQNIQQNPCAGSILQFYLQATEPPKVEKNNPRHDWKRIWRNINDSKFSTKTRSELFMIVNEKIETRRLMNILGRTDGENCVHCGARVETVIHKYSECQRVTEAWALVQRRISTIAGGWRRFSFVDLLRPTLIGINRNNRIKILNLFSLYITFINLCNDVVDIDVLEFDIQCGI